MTVGNDSGSFAAAGTTGQDTSSSPGAKEQAKQAAGTAADESQHVAGVAASEAQKVASEAKSQVQNLLGDATSQVEDQSRTQRDRLVGTLRTFTDDLDQMADGQGGIAADLVHEVADRARSLTSSLDGREPRELLDDVRRFARRKPGTFLLGALAAGVVAGRVTRGAKAPQSSSPSGASQGLGTGYPAPAVPATGAPAPVTAGSADTTFRPPAPRGVAGPVDPLDDPLASDPLASDPYAVDPANARRP
jgi:hypothetical protein